MGAETATKGTETAKLTKRSRELLDDYAKRMEQLDQERTEHEAALATLLKDREALGDYDIVNLKVQHSKFGEGTIASQNEKYIDVQFKDVVKKFVLPGAIADKYLKIEDEDVISYFAKSNDFHLNIVKEQLAIRSNDFAKDRLQEAIDKVKG